MSGWQTDDFEYAGDGLWINGTWYPPIHGGQDGGDGEGGDDEGDFDPEGPGFTPAPPGPLTSAGALEAGRELATQGVPLQLANLLRALETLRGRARGSTAAIFPGVLSQLRDLREQYSAASRAISRRLGAQGGGQTTRARQQLLTRTAGQYGNILSQAQQQGFAGLLNVLGGFQPLLSGAAREPNVATGSASPFDFKLAGQGIQGLLSLSQTLQNQAAQQHAQNTIAGFRTNPAYTVGLPDTTVYPDEFELGYYP